MRKNLLGHIQIDSLLLIIDIRKFIFNPAQYEKLGLLIETNGLGRFPVYREDDEEGGYGRSRIVIELGKNKHG